MSQTVEESMRRWPCVVETGAALTRYRERPRYAEGLYDLGAGIHAWMVPNGSWGESNCGLIAFEGEALLVDTQWDVPHTRQMLDAVATVLGDATLRYAVNTHADGDHWWGNELLDADVIASAAGRKEMTLTPPRSLVLFGVAGRALGLIPLRQTLDTGYWFTQLVRPYRFRGITPTPPKRTFDARLTMSVGGRDVELVELGPAHTDGDVVVLVPDAGVLFAGDLVFIGSTPVTWAGSAARCMAALDRILEMDVDVIVPGHGPITDKAGVRQVRDYWDLVARETGKRHEAGMSATQAASDIVRSEPFRGSPFADWNSPERMVVNTHTEYRHYVGRTSHPGTLERLAIMRRQALLAHELPDAEPSLLRRPRRSRG